MNPELPSLDSDLEQMLSAERGFPPVPGGVEAKLWATLAPQLPAQLPLHAAASAPPHAPGGALASAASVAKVSAKWPLAVAFALGGGAGAGVHAALVKPQLVQVAAPVAPVVAAPPAAPTVVPAPAPVIAEPVPTPKPAATHSPKTIAVADDPSLTSERALLEMGRTALARGQNRAAYEAMVDHEQRFPQGRLAEERDAIRIQALVGLGQLDAARLLAQSFRQAYPKSLLKAAVDRAVGP